jgi:hypothetical protein
MEDEKAWFAMNKLQLVGLSQIELRRSVPLTFKERIEVILDKLMKEQWKA